MRYLLAAAAVVTGVAATGVFLNVSRSNAETDTQIVTQFTPETIKAAVTEAGGEYVDAREHEGKQIIVYKMGERTYYGAVLCGEQKPQTCIGLELVASFNTKGVTITLDTVNSYNLKQVSGKALLIAATPAVDTARFLSAVGGITKKNFEWEIRNFHATTDALVVHVRDAGLTASIGVPTRPVVYSPNGGRPTLTPTHTPLPPANNIWR